MECMPDYVPQVRYFAEIEALEAERLVGDHIFTSA